MAKQDTPAARTATTANKPAPTAPAAVSQPTAQESTPMPSPAIAAGGNVGGNVVPFQGFKVKKIVTLPLLKLEQGKPIYVKFLEKMFRGKELRNASADDKKKEPPIIANVVNLQTGEQCQIMLGSVLQGILADDYPSDGYVGKGFMIELTEKKRGRSGGNYNTYKVAELDLGE